MTINFVWIALERNIELINAKVKIHVEHAYANTIHQLVRKLKMLSSTHTNKRNTSVTYPVVIISVDDIKCRALLDTGAASSYISSTIVCKLNKHPVRRDTKKIEMMLYATNSRLSFYNVTIKNLEDEFKLITE